MTTLYRRATSNSAVGDASQEELIAFIENQIQDPFGTSDVNLFKRLRRVMDPESDSEASLDDLDEVCVKMFRRIQDRYPGITIDVSDYDNHLDDVFMTVYKFFVVKIRSLLYAFTREFVFNNKNRQVLTDAYSRKASPTYPKRQFGTWEFYTLFIHLEDIIDEIFDDDIRLTRFIEFVERYDGGSSPKYIKRVKKMLSDGMLVDNGVIRDVYELYRASDRFREDLTRLKIDITSHLIMPYMEENKMMELRVPPTEEPPVELDDEETGDDGL